MDLSKSILETKNSLVKQFNIRTHENVSYVVKVVVGDSGFEAGSRDVFKEIVKQVYDLDKKDIVVDQIDDNEFFDEHTVVVLSSKGKEDIVFKNVTLSNVNDIIEKIK
ncbi:MAG: hypothetical protein ACK5LV_03935 [Lachnospirales bacterium]